MHKCSGLRGLVFYSVLNVLTGFANNENWPWLNYFAGSRFFAGVNFAPRILSAFAKNLLSFLMPCSYLINKERAGYQMGIFKGRWGLLSAYHHLPAGNAAIHSCQSQSSKVALQRLLITDSLISLYPFEHSGRSADLLFKNVELITVA